MANRVHVALVSAALPLFFAIAVSTSGCTEGRGPGADLPIVRGRVVDAVTGKGIGGAHVLARYEGTYGEGQSSCPWMEGAVADAEGYFTVTNHPKYYPPALSAFAPGYVRARSKRVARAEIVQGQQVWNVTILEDDDGRQVQKIVGREPERYRTEKDAEAASRQWTDAYLRPVRPEDDYKASLTHLHAQATCAKSGSVEAVEKMVEAVYAEQVRVGVSEAELAFSRSFKADRPTKSTRAK